MSTEFKHLGRNIQLPVRKLPTPGGEVQMALKEECRPGSIVQRVNAVYKATPVESAPTCMHMHTICTECYSDWASDYLIRVFKHGTVTAYRTMGCRCNVCKESAYPKEEVIE